MYYMCIECLRVFIDPAWHDCAEECVFIPVTSLAEVAEYTELEDELHRSSR